MSPRDYRLETMFECIPSSVFDLAPLPEGAAELVCELSLQASGLWCATLLDGIHRDVLRVAREGRAPGEMALDWGHQCLCYDSPADDPAGMDDADLSALRECLRGTPSAVPGWLDRDTFVSSAVPWAVPVPYAGRGLYLTCRGCGRMMRHGNGDADVFWMSFAWLHRGCAEGGMP